MLVTRINLAYTRNSYELGRKIKQVKMGKSQKRKCKRLTVHLTYFGGKQMKTQLPLFTFKTPQIWDRGSTRYWWPVKKWALCCKADGKGRLAATRESNLPCCPRRGPDTQPPIHFFAPTCEPWEGYPRAVTKELPADVENSGAGQSIQPE